MTRLPTPGSDDGTWGAILNDFLAVEHNADGTLKANGTLASKADNSSVVHISGGETVTGAKDFTGGLTQGGRALVDLETSASAQGLHRNTDSPTYGKWFTIGNAANSIGFVGTGTPAEGYGPFVIYQKYGTNNGANAPVTKTTQGGYLLTNYYGPTTDDSAEAFSTFVGIKDTGVGFNQAKPITGFEAIAQIEGANTANVGDGAPLLAGGFRTNVLGTSSVGTAIGVKVSHNSSGGPPYGTTTKYVGFYQSAASGATNAWGVYTVDKLQSETALVLAKSGNGMLFKADIAGSGGGTPAFVYAQNPDGTDFATVRLQAITGQNQPLLSCWAVGSSFANATITRLGSIISTAGFFAQNSSGVSQWGFDTSGPRWFVSGLEQTTVGAAGAASALPATPTKYLKVKDSAGTTLVIPAYAAS